MKVLMVNKFLYPHGGSETYILDIGRQLVKMGHEVQYFGMDDEQRTVGNRVESYTTNMDFHAGGTQKILYPFKILYSSEARKKIKVVLDDFVPDVIHLNNINFQITPSIIYEIRKWEKQKKRTVKIVYTAHDPQWVCPNHMMMIPSTKELCFRCKNGKYSECTKNKCIHNSFVKSLLGTVEAYMYKMLRTYKKVDEVICPSGFMRNTLASNRDLNDKLIVLHNYCETQKFSNGKKEDYILFFGRYSEEKGIELLINVCEQLPEIKFVFAGDGPLKEKIAHIKNVKDVGFLKGDDLRTTIASARLVVVPSIWYENCPFTVIEAQNLGTPVIGSNIGGIPELIDEGNTGELVTAGNIEQLVEKIWKLWNDNVKCENYSKRCLEKQFDNVESYCQKLLSIYLYN